MVYLFIGQDALSKDIRVQKIKQGLFPREMEAFNYDVLHGEEVTLQELQERLLSMPVKARKRMVLVKNAQELKEDAKEFLIRYAGKEDPGVELVLDVDAFKPNYGFIKRLTGHAQIARFNEKEEPDTFLLSRQIQSQKTQASLKILKQLLKNGERPEKIIGGLRSDWERYGVSSAEVKRKIGLLLKCDIEIKTGRLKAGFALEKCVVSLCNLSMRAMP